MFTIEIYLHEDKNCKQTYQINVLGYQAANGDEIEVLKEIHMTLANWLDAVETRDNLPFN